MLTNEYVPDELRAFSENAYHVVEQTVAKPIEGQALPATIYDGYPDIRSHKLYYEYASRIILGEWSISKFDEFVQRWNATGGSVVTERARKFWAKVNR